MTFTSFSLRTLQHKYFPEGKNLLFALSLASPYCLAQENGSEATSKETSRDLAVEETIVVGFRKSVRDSLSLKRSASTISEVISSEDIGKLPDTSIADSLSRMPGLAAQRLHGRSQLISIRGLSPDFSSTLLNGRQQVSVGDNRNIEFDIYPAELIGHVEVSKTARADLVGQGIAATVNMQSVKPLSLKQRHLSVNLQHVWTDLPKFNNEGDKSGYRTTLIYLDQYDDNKLGLAFGFTSNDVPVQGERFNAWGYPEFVDEDTGESVRVLGGAKPFIQSSTLKRDTFSLTLEYSPNERLNSQLDWYYSDFNENQRLKGIEIPLAWSAANLESYTVTNNFVTSGTFNSVGAVMRNDAEVRDSELRNLGWNLQYDINKNWVAELDLSQSEGDRTDRILETYSGITSSTDRLAFTSDRYGTLFTTTLDYSDPNLVSLTNVQNWGGAFVDGSQEGFYKQPAINDKLTQVTLKLKRDLTSKRFSIFKNLEFGLQIDERTKNKTTLPEYFIDLPNAVDTVQIPTGTETTPLKFLGINGMVSYNPLEVMASDVYDLVPDTRAVTLAKSWAVSEDVNTLYLKAGFESTLNEWPLQGDLGLQLVSTKQQSTALAATGNDPDNLQTTPIEGGQSYTNILPSLNIIVELNQNQVLRFGLSKTLQRPRMDELRASQEFNFDPTRVGTEISPWSAEGGNPNLDPWLSNNIDLAYENYFKNGTGAFTAALYYKDLDSYIYQLPRAFDFTNYPTPEGTDTSNMETTGDSLIPQNGSGGSIRGLELALTLEGQMFSPILDGFGTTISGALTNSNIKPSLDDDKQPLPGLSKRVFNLSFFYEKSGFASRLSIRHRSDFLGEVQGFDARRNFRHVDSETVLDAQISYNFSYEYLSGLSLVLQGNNLTDEPFVTTEEGDPLRVIDYQRYGANYQLGLTYKY